MSTTSASPSARNGAVASAAHGLRCDQFDSTEIPDQRDDEKQLQCQRIQEGNTRMAPSTHMRCPGMDCFAVGSP